MRNISQPMRTQQGSQLRNKMKKGPIISRKKTDRKTKKIEAPKSKNSFIWVCFEMYNLNMQAIENKK